MKKITLSAIVLGGLISAVTAQAGDYRYAGGGCSERAYQSTTVYVQPSRGYYDGSYASGAGYSYDYGYGQHQALHQDLRLGHQDLHVDLLDTHQAIHQELQHERDHSASRRWLKVEHHEMHHDLSDAHRGGHVQLLDAHRAGHYDLGW